MNGFFNHVVLTAMLKQTTFQKHFVVKRVAGLCFLPILSYILSLFLALLVLHNQD